MSETIFGPDTAVPDPISTYAAIVAPISVRKHPTADRIQLGLVCGKQVVVGKEAKSGELYLFFDSDGQLSEEFAKANDLIRRKDSQGKDAGGFFEPNRRVRVQKFRGQISDGFAMPVSCLEFTGGDISTLVAGTTLTSFNGVPICNKYETPRTKLARAANLQKAKVRHVEAPFFKRHFDTQQYKYYSRSVPAGANVIITEKLHGTSQRYGHLPVKRTKKLNWVQRLANKLLGPVFSEHTWGWEHCLGTRNVYIDTPESRNDYYADKLLPGENSEDFRRNCMRSFEGKLHKGETLYFEVVGWAGESTPIMGAVGVPATGDFSDLHKRFGPRMVYKYDQPQGTAKAYVYRITWTNPDGIVQELPWWAVEKRCEELGVATVPVLYEGYVYSEDELTEVVNQLTGDPWAVSYLDPTHIREGVAIRVEHRNYFGVLKSKGRAFYFLEGKTKDDANYIDQEEAS